MSNRKNHNSILFLTTLGVYLGLVLVGAPSGVFASPAAMTRNFDISEEIEFTENFDNDPDAADDPRSLLSELVAEFQNFSARDYFDVELAGTEPTAQFQFSFDQTNPAFAHIFIETPNPHFIYEAAGSKLDVSDLRYDSSASKVDNTRIILGTHLARAELDSVTQRA